jgi:glycosyltransferase involved in cell wall biosynthesis
MIIGVDASRAATGQRTGTEAYAYQLIQELIPLAQARGYHLRLYFNWSPPPGLFPDGPLVEQVLIPFPRLWTHIRLNQELRQRPPDVFFTPAHVIPIGYRRPSVATVHDLGYHHFPDAHTPGQRLYLRWSTRHNVRLARRVIADSQATADDLLRFYPIEPSKVVVIHPGVDPKLRPVTEEETLSTVWRKYGVYPPYFLYIGTLHPRKNLVRLAQAFTSSGLAEQESLYTLVLAGKTGWLAEPIIEALRNMSTEVSGRIHLPGFIDDANKAALLSGATALVFPSLYEGFGFPVLEAQACGTAVICANTSSLPEVAGRGALLVDPSDKGAITSALQQVAADSSLRERLIACGYENVQEFSWQKAATKVLETLELSAALG